MNEARSARRPKFRRRAEARPDDILDAALDLFIAHGFAATRVEDIAARAGLSKGAVYLYFPSKEKILEGLVRRAIVPIAERGAREAVAARGDAREALRHLLEVVTRRFGDPRVAAVPRIVLAEAGNFPELAAMYRREVIDRALVAVSGIVRRGVAEGAFRPVDPDLAIRSIVGPLLVHFVAAPLFGLPQGNADAFLDHHVAMILRGLAPAPGATA